MSVEKEVVSVAEMAEMIGLSRSRFYQLVDEGVFPSPSRDKTTRRPFYSRELQEQCLTVRRRNMGVNGKPVMFYAKRTRTTQPSTDTINDVQNAGPESAKLDRVLKKTNSALEKMVQQGKSDVDGKTKRDMYLKYRRREFGG